jgi:hypothetical protein
MMIATCKNACTAYLVVLICRVAGFGQAPPEIKAKLDAKIKQLASFSTDPEVVNAVKDHNATPAAEAQDGYRELIRAWRDITAPTRNSRSPGFEYSPE